MRTSSVVGVVLAMLVGGLTVAALLIGTGRVQLGGKLPLLPGQPTPVPAPLAAPVQPSPSGTYWGAFVPRADVDQAVVPAFAAAVGRQPAIVTMYEQWYQQPAFPTAAARRLEAAGIVPMVVWEPWQPALPAPRSTQQPAYALSAIAGGSFDTYVRSYADQIKAYGGPLFLEPLHEMNGNWYPWGGTVNGNTTADYVAAWRHLHDVFAARGATNVTWVWTTNRDTVPDTPANQPANYWPGAAYVDWVGLDAYNWGTAQRKAWTSVAVTFNRNLASLATLGKPIIIAETACAEVGGDKAAWIDDLYAALTGPYRGQVSAVVWFDQAYNVFDWRTNSSPAAQTAFSAGVARPGMISGVPGGGAAG